MRLIATDIDGTLLPSDHTLSPRTLAVVQKAVDAGVHLVAASGRQLFSIRQVLAGTPFIGPAVGSNGAVVGDLMTGDIWAEQLLAVEAQTALFVGLLDRFPDIRCVSVRGDGRAFVPQRGYSGFMDPGDHARAGEFPEYDLADVLGSPSVKFVVRDPGVDVEDLLGAALELAIPGCQPTVSGAAFLEVSAVGVTKASGLARVCERLGVASADVVAFGDNANDVEMLEWAGLGVAVANARPEVLAIADEITESHDDDGVAMVIERLLGQR